MEQSVPVRVWPRAPLVRYEKARRKAGLRISRDAPSELLREVRETGDEEPLPAHRVRDAEDDHDDVAEPERQLEHPDDADDQARNEKPDRQDR